MITPTIRLNSTVLVGEFFPVLNILSWGELSRVGSGAMNDHYYDQTQLNWTQSWPSFLSSNQLIHSAQYSL